MFCRDNDIPLFLQQKNHIPLWSSPELPGGFGMSNKLVVIVSTSKKTCPPAQTERGAGKLVFIFQKSGTERSAALGKL